MATRNNEHLPEGRLHSPARESLRPPRADVAVPAVLSRTAKVSPRAVPVGGISPEVVVKIASERTEWRDAFKLVAENYQAVGYEAPHASKVRFTEYHALPDTVTFVAKQQDRVVMTLSLVPDNTLLGLPLEVIFSEEVRALRRQRRRMGEIISLAADKSLGLREFRTVFVAIIRLMKQYHVAHGGDTWVITVNPKHSSYYTKAVGYLPLGPVRSYEAVRGAPAEAYVLDVPQMAARAPKMYAEVFGEWLPGDALVAPKMLAHMVRYLGNDSSKEARETIQETFDLDRYFTTPRRW